MFSLRRRPGTKPTKNRQATRTRGPVEAMVMLSKHDHHGCHAWLAGSDATDRYELLFGKPFNVLLINPLLSQ